MAIYLVDYENVKSNGLKGINECFGFLVVNLEVNCVNVYAFAYV